MRVIILGKEGTPAYQGAHQLITNKGHQVVEPGGIADLAIAPLLTERLPPGAIYAPKHGTLIFHPSPLPHGRGASAIRWAYERKEPITVATWFWANLYKMDSGSICEQEVIKIDHSQRPREFYNEHMLPAMLRTLERALDSIAVGYVRRVPQVEVYASIVFYVHLVLDCCISGFGNHTINNQVFIYSQFIGIRRNYLISNNLLMYFDGCKAY